MRKGLLDPNGRSCGGKGGRGGSMMGRGDGWLAKRSIISNEGCGGSRLVVHGGKSSREDCLDGLDGVTGGEVNDRRVVLRVFKSLLGEVLDDVMGESGGETMRLDGGTVCIVRLVKYLKGMGEGMSGTR
nr:hypothetical protein [Tanacetum cinerariifolium]